MMVILLFTCKRLTVLVEGLDENPFDDTDRWNWWPAAMLFLLEKLVPEPLVFDTFGCGVWNPLGRDGGGGTKDPVDFFLNVNLTKNLLINNCNNNIILWKADGHRRAIYVPIYVCLYPSSAHSFDPIVMKLGMDTPLDPGNVMG